MAVKEFSQFGTHSGYHNVDPA